MKSTIRKNILSLFLLICFSIPFIINGLHFAIFEHQHHESLSQFPSKYSENNETHGKCLWEFAHEEIVNQDFDFKEISIAIFAKQTISCSAAKQLAIQHFSLRAPPVQA